MNRSLAASAALFVLLLICGAWLCDSLIQLTQPGDPCYHLFLWVTVAIFSAAFLLCMAYIGVLTIRVVEGRWVRGFPNRSPVHAIGCATLLFTAFSPFIVLHGPKSSVSYGERVAVTEALEHALSAQRAVESFWRQHAYFPGSVGEAGIAEKPDSVSTAVGLISVTNDGAITLNFTTPRYANLDARTLVIRPSRSAAGFEWDCRGGDLPDHVRPARCRRDSACRVLAL